MLKNVIMITLLSLFFIHNSFPEDYWKSVISSESKTKINVPDNININVDGQYFVGDLSKKIFFSPNDLVTVGNVLNNRNNGLLYYFYNLSDDEKNAIRVIFGQDFLEKYGNNILVASEIVKSHIDGEYKDWKGYYVSYYLGSHKSLKHNSNFIVIDSSILMYPLIRESIIIHEFSHLNFSINDKNFGQNNLLINKKRIDKNFYNYSIKDLDNIIGANFDGLNEEKMASLVSDSYMIIFSNIILDSNDGKVMIYDPNYYYSFSFNSIDFVPDVFSSYLYIIKPIYNSTIDNFMRIGFYKYKMFQAVKNIGLYPFMEVRPAF